MMILDPTRTFRNRFGADFEQKFEATYRELYPKFASASVEFIDALDLTLTRMIDGLNTLRKADKANDRSTAPD